MDQDSKTASLHAQRALAQAALRVGFKYQDRELMRVVAKTPLYLHQSEGLKRSGIRKPLGVTEEF